MLDYNGIKIFWLGHDGFRIEKDLVIYVDPFQLKGKEYPKADLVFITHHHFDHCSLEDIRKLVGSDTIIVCNRTTYQALQKLHAQFSVVEAGQAFSEMGIMFDAVPAYNVNKYRDPEKKIHFHPKEEGHVGYILDIDGVRIYHPGDSDFIPEMKNVKCDIALLPVSGTYVMTAEEAAEAAKALQPKIAVPMHYGAIVGQSSDAEKFHGLLHGTVRVEIMAKEE